MGTRVEADRTAVGFHRAVDLSLTFDDAEIGTGRTKIDVQGERLATATSTWSTDDMPLLHLRI